MSIQVLAASVSITFSLDGVTGYDSIITTSTVKAGSNSSIEISKIYCKTVQADDEVSIAKDYSYRIVASGFCYLNADETTPWSKKKTSKKISEFAPAFETNEQSLIEHGLDKASIASGCSKYYFLGIIPNIIANDKQRENFGILIQVAGGGTLTDSQKKPLTDLLATVADGNNNYIQSGDRYNGNPADTITDKNSGFWATFTAKNGPREQAQKALKAATSEGDIEKARAALQAEIDKLIPTSQLNATYLYETLQQSYQSLPNDYLDESFTAPSVRNYRNARSDAQEYLNSLFDSDGTPTDKNKAENQNMANGYADALKKCEVVSKDAVEESKVNLRTIQALAKRYAMTENDGKYTEESWEAFTAAREAAVTYAAEHPISENVSADVPKAYSDLTRAFLTAAYELKPAGDVTITFVYTDDLHLRSPNSGIIDPAGNKPQIREITLPAGSTIQTLCTETNCVPDQPKIDINGYSVYHTFVNGTMLYGVTPGAYYNYDVTKYVLKDGDVVQLSHMEWPSYVFNYIYRQDVDWTNMSNALGVLRFQETGAQSVAAGESKTLTVERTSAHLWTYTGSYSAFEGATVAAYGPLNEDGSYPDTPILLTGTSSDANGSVSFKLYQEGTYLVTAYDARANDEDQSIFYSGNIAAPYLELTVGDATQPDAVRAELKAALDKVYNAYPKKIFGDDAWADIEKAYKAAVATLNDLTATTGEAYLAQQTAIRFIQSKQTETVQANKTALETFRRYLNNLPDDTAKITESAAVKETAQKLLQCYKDMNSYQRSQITGAEKAKYEKIKAYMEANGEKLPAAQKYKLTLNVVGDTDDATAALNDMIGYLHDHPAMQDRGPGGSGDHTTAINIDTP
ncbi:MAG: hypothetical protein J7E11_15610, partial [Escherichia coli]|nr:hypothetical protein [Escherichia coli]